METVSRSVPFKVVRAAEDGDGLTLTGYAAVFNSPTRIRGEIPREFDEIIAPGAFKRTINARTPVLQFDHGQNPHIGSIPIGQITQLREDKRGLYVEARLFDNDLVKPIRDAIAGEAIQGMSFRFSVPEGKEEWDRTGDIPLRTIHEVRCIELGPVVFPAYEDTLVGVRNGGFEIANSLVTIDEHLERLDGVSGVEVVSNTPEEVVIRYTRTVTELPDVEDIEETEIGEEPVDETDTRDEPAEDGTSDLDPSEAPEDSQPDSTPTASLLDIRFRMLELESI